MNIVMLIGHLGADPELKTIQSGTQLCRMRIAVRERWYDKNTNQKQERTHWFTVTAWGKQAETCGKWLHKGSKIAVRGSLEYREWAAQDGTKRNAVEIKMDEMEMLDPPSSGGNNSRGGGFNGGGQPRQSAGGFTNGPSNGNRTTQQQPEFPEFGGNGDNDDDIPF